MLNLYKTFIKLINQVVSQISFTVTESYPVTESIYTKATSTTIEKLRN